MNLDMILTIGVAVLGGGIGITVLVLIWRGATGARRKAILEAARAAHGAVEALSKRTEGKLDDALAGLLGGLLNFLDTPTGKASAAEKLVESAVGRLSKKEKALVRTRFAALSKKPVI